jgi:predicted kinase
LLIVFSGLPGTGKSTVARALARATGAVHVRIDSIEHALRSGGIDVQSEGYVVAYAIAEDNLRAGRTVIADCVNPWRLTRDAWHGVAARAGAPALDVEFVCSDRDEHRRRVEARLAGGGRADGYPSWQDVLDRDYQRWDRDRLVIDTAGMAVDDSVKALVGAVDAARRCS